MEVSIDLSKRYSYADYLTSIFDNIRCELMDGFVKLMAAPKDIHVEVCSNIHGNLWNFLNQNRGDCKIRIAPYDVRFPRGETANNVIFDVVQPDICIICDLSKIDDNGCIGAPDFIVEVHSPSNTKKIMNYKFNLYEKHGVREYWVVYPKDRSIVVFLNKDGKYNDGTVYEKGQIPITIFENCSIDFSSIFTN